MKCPCQSAKSYDDCCARYISQQAQCENAEQLMRSRYSAYVLNQVDYLQQTWHPDYRPSTLKLDPAVQWTGLTVMDFSGQGDRAEVEFEARFIVDGRVEGLHERSDFVLEQGRWYYTRGEILTPTFSTRKPGRNEACPCGSGRKFKRCCGG